MAQSVTITGSPAQSCADPSPLLAPDGSILLYYTMFASTGSSPSIGVAQSSNGLSFTHLGIVYTAGANGFGNVTDPFPLILPGGTVRVFFSPAGSAVYSTTSTDPSGLKFPGTLDPGVRSSSGGVPGALIIGSTSYLYVNAGASGTTSYLKASDGLSFSPAGTLSLPNSDAFSPINAGNGTYLASYQCAGSGPTGGVVCLASSTDGINWAQTSQIGGGSVPGLVKTSSGQLLVYVVPAASSGSAAVRGASQPTVPLTPSGRR